MTMYQPNIPTGLVNLDEDYLNILHNFQQLNTTYGVNHVAFADVPGNGKHTFVEMKDNTMIPAGLAADEGTLYTKTNTGVTDLFYTPDISTNEYQLTRTISASFTRFGTNLSYGSPPVTFTQTGGWTFLPGGLLMQYGFYGKTGALGTSGTIQFPVAFTSGVFSITNSLKRTSSGNQSVTINTVGLNSFTFLSSSSASDGIYWQAIGN